MSSIVVIRFEREAGDVTLDPSREYRVSVDGGPYGVFHSPWTQAQLDELVATLRNAAEVRPDMESMRQIGRDLADAMYEIAGLPGRLQPGTTVYWQLDYPELAHIPWELATTNQPPYPHLLLDDITFVRRIPAAIPDQPAQWPTGRNETLRLLYVWSERPDSTVPHDEHLKQLDEICSRYGAELVAQAVPDVATLAKLCGSKRFHFVHLLAHGARVDGEWGLRLERELAKGEQIARALVAKGTTPALVTVSACDSANEPNNSFGSVAYHLHVYGIPLVLASQFRLRQDVSTASVAHVYEEFLGGGDPIGVLGALRRQLAPAGNEAWANEVVYSRYRDESLSELAVVARQQAALRRARSIARRKDLPADEAICELEKQSDRLQSVVNELRKDVRRNREALAETFGLLGSLRRRIAELRCPVDFEELRTARSHYEAGFRADANSHYCGINVVHLSLRVGDQQTADTFIPRVRLAAENDVSNGVDFWAHATLGDCDVYDFKPDAAAEHYRDFVRALERECPDAPSRVENIRSASKPLSELGSIFSEADFPDLHRALKAVGAVLDSALRRHSAAR